MTTPVSLYASAATNYDRATERTLTALMLMYNISTIAHVRNPNSSGGYIVVKTPWVMGEPWSDKWYTLSDNGGEVQVSLVNGWDSSGYVLGVGVPFTNCMGAVITAETMAYRLAAVMRRERIDWGFEAPSLQAYSPKFSDTLPIEPKWAWVGGLL